MHQALHPTDDVDKPCVSKNDGDRRLVSIKNSVDALIKGLEDYREKSRGRLITMTRKTTDMRINRPNIDRKNGKKNNTMDISSDKQATSNPRKLRL